MLEVGNKAPFIKIENQDGCIVDLEALDKNIVLYFYPKDDTPGCTLEGKEFTLLKEEFLKLDTQVFGVSKDSIKSHLKFKDKYCFNFDLLSDSELILAKAFDAWGEKSMFGVKYQGILRKTFFISKNKVISKIWPKVTARNHAREVLDFVTEFTNKA
jgi:peroxiredoxin Q/BCP